MFLAAYWLYSPKIFVSFRMFPFPSRSLHYVYHWILVVGCEYVWRAIPLYSTRVLVFAYSSLSCKCRVSGSMVYFFNQFDWRQTLVVRLGLVSEGFHCINLQTLSIVTNTWYCFFSKCLHKHTSLLSRPLTYQK